MRKMKDSGIEWIGEIPEDWKLNKISAIYSERNIKVSDKEFQPLSVTKSGILPQLENAAKTNNGDSRKLIKKNDFVINSRSDRRGSCGISEYDGSCSLINIVLKPFKNIFNKYYSYVFRSDLFADEFYRWGHGIVDDLWSTKWSEMKRIYIPEPTLNEQIRIANFLDEKCAVIDRLVERHQEVIEKLKAYRQSVISEAVTRGLDPDAPMKDSGIPWIGKIPENWKTSPIKSLATIQTGNTPKNIKIHNTDSAHKIPWIKPENLGYSKPITETEIYFSYNEQDSIKLIQENSVFVCCIGSIGKVGYSNIKCCSNQQINAITFNKEIYWKFGYYAILSQEKQHWFYANGNVLKILNSNKHGEIRIAIPPYPEQFSISNFLDEKCAKIDRIIQDKEQIIAKLAEYKKSIIYEYVTGKKEVPAS